MPKFDYLGAKKAGYSDQDIASYLKQEKAKGNDLYIDRNEFSSSSQIKKTGILEKASNAVDATLGRASDLIFGNTKKAVGSMVTDTIGSAEELVGQATGSEQLQQRGQAVQRQANVSGNLTPGNIAGTVLEGTISGLGEKTMAKVASRFSAPLMARAEKMYQSALKPTNALLKKSPDVVKTGLKEGARVSEGGLGKVKGIIEDIGEDIGKVIDQGVADGKSVTKSNLAPYLDEMKEYLGNSLGGKELVNEVDDVIVKVLNELPENIPIKQAQTIKQNTQRILAKYYGRFAPVEAEAKKQLTRGLKEEIAKEVPEIAALNARDRSLIGLEGALEAAVKRMGNREVINGFDVISAGVGLASPTGGLQKGVGLLALKKIFQSPTVKSQSAIWMNKLGENGAKLLKAGRYPAAIATAKILSLFSDQED